MVSVSPFDLSYLDQCLVDIQSVRRLKSALDKLEKCCLASNKHNLADIVGDPENRDSLLKAFSTQGFDTGIQIMTKLSLADYACRSVLTFANLASEKKMGFLARCLSGWKLFDIVLVFQYPKNEWQPVRLVNPKRSGHWKSIKSIPEGTLVTGFFKMTAGKQSRTQEELACDRFEAIFDTIQTRREPMTAPTPNVQVNTKKQATPKRRLTDRHLADPAAGTLPVSTLKVVINKMDGVVHAGNANLIMTQVRGYQGRILFFVLRPDKVRVQLDPDTIWAAEIRNGETVLFEFYGPTPPDGFLKDLASCVNRYTQMDKIANG